MSIDFDTLFGPQNQQTVEEQLFGPSTPVQSEQPSIESQLFGPQQDVLSGTDNRVDLNIDHDEDDEDEDSYDQPSGGIYFDSEQLDSVLIEPNKLGQVIRSHIENEFNEVQVLVVSNGVPVAYWKNQ